jgi:hypothetical protein
LGWGAPPKADDLALPFVATGEPWRSTIVEQLKEEEEDAVASPLGAVPIAKDHRVRIPCTAASFCT